MDISPLANPSTPASATRPRVESAETKSVAPAPEPASATIAPAQKSGDSQQVSQAVKRINKTLEQMSSSLEFSVDTDTREIVVKVIDTQTKDVIRQIPSEETLEISKALDQATGLLIKQKA